MKTTIYRTAIFIAICLTAYSCTTALKVRTTVSQKQLPELKTIALVSVAIPPITKPVFPVIDAAAFNAKVNSIADQIMDIQQKRIDTFRETLANNISNFFKSTVLYGDKLHVLVNFPEIAKKNNFPGSLQLENNNFPFIVNSSGDINPFPFEKGNIGQFFSNKINYQIIAKELCSKLGTDAIAVSYTNLNVTDAAAFGIRGGLALSSSLYIFDKEGYIIISGSYTSKPTMISGKDISDYMMKLDEFNTLCYMIVNQMAIDYSTPKK